MQIQYVIINFVILLVILILAGRKTVKRIFGGRLERINRELDEAEAIEKLEMPVFESVYHSDWPLVLLCCRNLRNVVDIFHPIVLSAESKYLYTAGTQRYQHCPVFRTGILPSSKQSLV